ncbi:MAG: cellulase family glycosylhydrolase [Chitinispirillaceae bacterium]
MRKLEKLAISATLMFSGIFSFTGIIHAQTLPPATEIAREMSIAWNIGNTMEVPEDPTAWGNPLPTQTLIDSVKAGGFNTIRIPCAWDSHADQATLVIDQDWIAQVKEVVDYCISRDLFVILNSHWDGGWLEENITASAQDDVNRKQGAYWHQIATAFRDYDHHLLFAGANEPAVQDPHGTDFGADRMAVLNSYLQTFIDTVRATGGNNASRTLIIQGPRADIDLTNQVMTTLPTDHIDDRLMAEVHFYPYQFTLMEEDEDWGKVFYYWGQQNHSTTDTDRNPTWGEEDYVDEQFDKMKTQFVDNGIPVILGEFGAAKRLTLPREKLERHLLSRRTYYEYVVSAALSRGIIPVAWDTGYKGNLNFTIFDRVSFEVHDLGLLNAIRAGAGLSKLEGDTSLVPESGNNAMKILYSAKDSLWGQVDLGVVRSDMTTYDSIIVRAYVNGQTTYEVNGETQYGFVEMNLVTMSDEWTWREAPLGEVSMDGWADYSIPLSNDTTDEGALVPADPAQIDFFALQTYSEGYRGTIYIDHILFIGSDGSVDTAYSFDLNIPASGEGNVETVSMIAVDDVSSDTEWETATSGYPATTVTGRSFKGSEMFRAFAANGYIRALYTLDNAGAVTITLQNLQGRTILSRSAHGRAGTNSLDIPTDYSGVAILQIKHKDKTLIGKVVNH